MESLKANKHKTKGSQEPRVTGVGVPVSLRKFDLDLFCGGNFDSSEALVENDLISGPFCYWSPVDLWLSYIFLVNKRLEGELYLVLVDCLGLETDAPDLLWFLDDDGAGSLLVLRSAHTVTIRVQLEFGWFGCHGQL